MKCSDFKKEIVRFDELPAKQQEGLTEHMQSCPQCLLFYQEQEEFFVTIKDTFAATEVPTDQNGLTNRIMRSLPVREPQGTLWNLQLLASALQPVRLACTVVSFSMIILFLAQYRSAPAPVASGTTQEGSVPLNTELRQAFAEKWMQRSKTPGRQFSFLACLQQCQNNSGTRCDDCIKSTTNN
jgi:hypothetical protein